MSFFNNVGMFFGNILNNSFDAVKTAVKEIQDGYEASNTLQFSSEQESWHQVVVNEAKVVNQTIFMHATDVKSGKAVVMTITLGGIYHKEQVKKLGFLLFFMGKCPVESVEKAAEAINEAPEKRLLVTLKGWKGNPTKANLVRVLAHNHVAKDESKPKAEAKGKGKKANGKAKQLDESC